MTTMRLQAAGKTDQGLKRLNNEDSLLVDEESGIYIIADGMGGHSAGEVASALAMKTVNAGLKEGLSGCEWVSSPHVHLPQDGDRKEEDTALRQIMMDAIQAAHRAIQQKTVTDSTLAGMGTTLVAMIIRAGCAYICHSGDSRAYLFRKNMREHSRESDRENLRENIRASAQEKPRITIRENLRQLTVDHTVGEYLVTTEGIPRDRVPPRQWHILTQALGTEADPSPDFTTLALRHGDLLLLCTDGLTDMLPDIEIESILNCHDRPASTGGKNSEHEAATLLQLPQPGGIQRRDHSNADTPPGQLDAPVEDLGTRAADLEFLAENLVAAANARGGRDNISLILVRYE